MHHRVRLRPARPEDEAFLRAVFDATFLPFQVLDLPAAERCRIARLQYDLQDRHYRATFPGADFDVVLLDERPVGRLYVDRSADAVHGIDIGLLPAYRGQGIGTLLVTQLIEEASAAGKPFRFHVEKGNRARGLYERLGCQVIADRDSHWLMEHSAGAGSGRAGQPGTKAPS